MVTRRGRIGLTFLALGALVGCGGGTEPSAPPPPPPAPSVGSVEVTPGTSSLFAVDTVRLVARVLDQHGAPLSGKTVSWSTSAPLTASVSSAGLVTAIAAGTATISASVEGKTGSAAVAVRAADSLPGAPVASAVGAIPEQAFVSRAQDYSTNHPALPGARISFNTVTLLITATATVGGVNALLTEFGARIVGGARGVPGQAAGFLFVRLPTTSHAELIPRLEALRQSPVVAAATADIVLEPQVISKPNGGTPPGWEWSLAPGGGAWGIIAIRIPAMWNFNDAIRKSGVTTATGVLDAGFSPHPDLIYGTNLSPDVPVAEHGTHVAGTIAATFGNGLGVDGVNPFAQLIVFGKSTTGDMLSGLGSLLDARPDLRVVNISLGYNWGPMGIDTRSGARGAAARFVADVDGTMVAARLSGLAALGRTLPVIVAAAANDSNDGFGDQDAVHATPFANAALAHGAAPIIVVEAVDLGSAGSLTRASFSNLGGHVSAPGVDIQSTALANGYAVLSGTSMAAPHVAGLVSYIYSLDPAFPAPTMTANPMRELLVRNGQAAFGGAAKVVDGFATALDLDRIRGDRRTLKLLLDVDDGTLDGNTRLNADGSVNSTDAKGDGTIDMSDFRRWRDWLLQAEDASNLDLDGADNHPKKDLNGDGVVSTPTSKELIHPRGDFNGDGEISRGKTRVVPGVKNGQPATDLEVLQVLFQDPDYQAAELPDLIDSWDLEVDPARCLGLPGVTTVQTTVSESGQSGTIAARTHTAAARRRIITLPVTSGLHQVRVEAFNGSGTPIASRQQEFNPNAGADFPLDPVCASLDVSVVFPATVVPGTPNVLDVKAGDRDPLSGIITFSSGIDIDVVAAGGTVVPATGQTGSGGQFIASATLSTGNTLLTLAVTATRSDGVSTTKIVSATGTTPPPPPPPPPPDNCPDVRIDDDADVAAASGLTCFLNARIGGFNNRLTVLVSLPQLTQVVEAFGVQFEVPGGLSLPALKTLGTGAVFQMAKLATLDLPALTESRSTTGNSGGIIVSNAADLTTIKFGALQRVDGGLAIETNPKLTDISGIACGVRVNGNLWIRNNPLLSTSAAQAKANCMIVTGTTTISGNQSP